MAAWAEYLAWYLVVGALLSMSSLHGSDAYPYERLLAALLWPLAALWSLSEVAIDRWVKWRGRRGEDGRYA